MMMADLEAAKRARVAQAALMPLMEEDAEVKAVRRAENMAHVEAAKRAREEAEEEEARSAQQEAVAVGSVQEEKAALIDAVGALANDAGALRLVDCRADTAPAATQTPTTLHPAGVARPGWGGHEV